MGINLAAEMSHYSEPKESASAPFFSIGVTTYDRVEMLIETLNSILDQTFRDYEVIVSNDNSDRTLTGESLGIHDPRVIFINQPKNLGEVYNMDFLLKASRGKYFTWLADDDLYAPVFLETIHKALVRNSNASVIFTSYMAGTHFVDERRRFISPAECRLLTGSEFLNAYLSKSIMVLGCSGVFRKEYLQKIGGMENLGQGFSPYSDNWLVIKTSLLDQVGYVNSPLFFFRTHEKSISFASPDVDAYMSAQKDLLAKSCDLLLSESLRDNFHENMFLLLVWCLRDFGSVIRRPRSISMKQVQEYIVFLKKYATKLKGLKYYLKIWMVLMRIAIVVTLDMAKKSVHGRTASTVITTKNFFIN